MECSRIYRLSLAAARTAVVVLAVAASSDGLACGWAQSDPVKPSQANALIESGLKAYRANQFPQALAHLREAYRLAPRDPRVHLLLGLLEYERDSASLEAQRLMELAAPRFPENLELQL